MTMVSWMYGFYQLSSTLRKLTNIQNSTLHLVLRLRGGGLPKPGVTIASGGRIKQVIHKDPYPPKIWDTKRTTTFGVQLFDASEFENITGFEAPPTPIDAKAYADHGYPFFELYEEESGVSGNFPLQSVATLDWDLMNEYTKLHEQEESLEFPFVILSPQDGTTPEVETKLLGKTTSFLPIRTLEKKAKEA